jgi:hypothetical protein
MHKVDAIAASTALPPFFKTIAIKISLEPVKSGMILYFQHQYLSILLLLLQQRPLFLSLNDHYSQQDSLLEFLIEEC